MTSAEYAAWLAVARRHARKRDDAEDLLQDALLAAARADRFDLGDEGNRRWLTGALRNQAAFQARSAARRRQRESAAAPDSSAPPLPEPSLEPWPDAELRSLPPSARRVLALALHGLGRDEICAVLGLSATAFRQRLVALRRGLSRLPAEFQHESRALACARRDVRGGRLALGLIRRTLAACLRASPGLGTHDPDGHALVLSTKS